MLRDLRLFALIGASVLVLLVFLLGERPALAELQGQIDTFEGKLRRKMDDLRVKAAGVLFGGS